jgi:hypothetical protein
MRFLEMESYTLYFVAAAQAVDCKLELEYGATPLYVFVIV